MLHARSSLPSPNFTNQFMQCHGKTMTIKILCEF